uniref:RRM domain-containing protein n=1 Tax=Zea mays TaxID=4577 RepID=A0A804RLX3_MAIZE
MMASDADRQELYPQKDAGDLSSSTPVSSPWALKMKRASSRPRAVSQSSFGFIDYHDRRYAALAILSLNGRQLYGQPIKVNWAYTSTPREGTSGHFNIFVGDLCPEVTDATLFAFFSGYSTCSDASVMWDQKTGRSRGFGFVSFRNQQDAQSEINDLNGVFSSSMFLTYVPF